MEATCSVPAKSTHSAPSKATLGSPVSNLGTARCACDLYDRSTAHDRRTSGAVRVVCERRTHREGGGGVDGGRVCGQAVEDDAGGMAVEECLRCA